MQIKQGVPQGSTLGPLFYVIYANDIPEELKCKAALYADDTVVYDSSRKQDKIESNLQRDMNSLENKLTINANKTKLMIFGNKKCRERVGTLNVSFEGKPIDQVAHYNYLGIKLDQTLKYDMHARALIKRVSDKLVFLRRIRQFINAAAALHIYKNMIFQYWNMVTYY